MNRTVLDHPLVTAYLRQLDTALAPLPAGPARELREQITGHLDDALAPDTGDQQVAEELRRLGRPADLAAEVAATAGKRSWLARVGWRWWGPLAAVVIAAAVLAAYLVPMDRTGPLTVGGLSSWWYAQDAGRQVITTADGVTQTAVPIRKGQWQGLIVEVENDTGRPQTVLKGIGPLSFGNARYHFAMAPDDPDHLLGSFRTLRYGLPVTIPPGHSRLLRILWITGRTCRSVGSSEIADQVSLRVRVGLFTRTETLPLGQGWALTGTDTCGY